MKFILIMLMQLMIYSVAAYAQTSTPVWSISDSTFIPASGGIIGADDNSVYVLGTPGTDTWIKPGFGSMVVRFDKKTGERKVTYTTDNTKRLPIDNLLSAVYSNGHIYALHQFGIAKLDSVLQPIWSMYDQGLYDTITTQENYPHSLFFDSRMCQKTKNNFVAVCHDNRRITPDGMCKEYTYIIDDNTGERIKKSETNNKFRGDVMDIENPNLTEYENIFWKAEEVLGMINPLQRSVLVQRFIYSTEKYDKEVVQKIYIPLPYISQERGSYITNLSIYASSYGVFVSGRLWQEDSQGNNLQDQAFLVRLVE